MLCYRQDICVITRCADTERVPPARGVMVSAAAFPAGLRTVRTEFVAVVVTTAIPTICDVPVAPIGHRGPCGPSGPGGQTTHGFLSLSSQRDS